MSVSSQALLPNDEEENCGLLSRYAAGADKCYVTDRKSGKNHGDEFWEC